MTKALVKNEEELNKFIEAESWGAWPLKELKNEIKPKSYPCIIIIHWGEGSNGSYLCDEVVYPSDFNH